jgi:hypothetical protein
VTPRLLALCVVVAAWLAPGLASGQAVPLAPQFGGGGEAGRRDPQELQMPLRAPLTLVPTITISEEFNDNVNLDNDNRRWDFVTGITPGLSFVWESRTHQVLASYSFTSELYARDESRNTAFANHAFTLSGTWRATEQLTLNLADTLTASTDTNLVAPEGVATGRSRSLGNVLSAGAAYQIDPLTLVRGGASHALLRFEDDELFESDVYRAGLGVQRRLSTTLQGTAGYDFGYFDIEREEKVTTHTPRVGAIWQVLPMGTLTASAGPTFEQREDRDSRITPAVTVAYDHRVRWGVLGIGFDRQVATAGGLGGTTDNTSVTGRAEVTTLARGLTLSILPRFAWVKSDNDRVDITSFTLPIQAAYRITAWMAAVARYQFFHQRTDSELRDRSGNLIAADADQNRILIGLQFGYPITFDRP